MFDNLKLTLQVRRERKRTAAAIARIQEEQKARHAFMMELSQAGYSVVKNPTL
jgi:hypothetical protein